MKKKLLVTSAERFSVTAGYRDSPKPGTKVRSGVDAGKDKQQEQIKPTIQGMR